MIVVPILLYAFCVFAVIIRGLTLSVVDFFSCDFLSVGSCPIIGHHCVW